VLDMVLGMWLLGLLSSGTSPLMPCLLDEDAMTLISNGVLYSHMNKCSVVELQKLKLLTTHFFFKVLLYF